MGMLSTSGNALRKTVLSEVDDCIMILEPKSEIIVDLVLKASQAGISIVEAETIDYLMATLELGARPSIIALSVDSLQNSTIKLLCALRARGFTGSIICYYSKAMTQFMLDTLDELADWVLAKPEFYNHVLLSNPIHEAA